MYESSKSHQGLTHLHKSRKEFKISVENSSPQGFDKAMQSFKRIVWAFFPVVVKGGVEVTENEWKKG